MIFSTTNHRVTADAPRDKEFELPVRLNEELLSMIRHVTQISNYNARLHPYTINIDEDYFLSFMSYDQREQANDPWPFCRRAMWPEYLLGFSVKYIRNAGWNVALLLSNGTIVCDTGTSEEPPYER
jgi:hypothetical protein